MTKLPIAICLFTSTKGHFGHSTYLDTLRHLDRQIPLSCFGGLYAHIKMSPKHEAVAKEMADNLIIQGFDVDGTVGDWQRGSSHQTAYLIDQRKASEHPTILNQRYMLLLEDDSVMVPHKCDLAEVLARMTAALEKDPHLMSTRFLRRCDYDGGVPIHNPEPDHFFSPNTDFQPMILRSRDFLLVHKLIEDHWDQLSHLQCELVMRIGLDTFSRRQNRHLVWFPDYAETVHLGVPDYPAIKASLNL